MTNRTISDTFLLQRSYIKGVCLNGPPGSYWLDTSNPYILQLPVSYLSPILYMRFRPEFHAWSSNGYHGPWVMTDYYGLYPGGSPINFDVSPLRFIDKPGTVNQYLTGSLNFFSDYYYADLPAPPAGWWYHFPP
jgi:hypothetical protein